MDHNAAKLKVSIDDVSRLRKLKKTEDEQVIEGSDYATRLKEHYVTKMQGEHSMFDWARSKDSAPGRKGTAVDSDDEDDDQGTKPAKMFADSSDEDSDDPIGNLLKSNTSVFSRKEDVLKNGILKYSKLRNANAGTQH